MTKTAISAPYDPDDEDERRDNFQVPDDLSINQGYDQQAQYDPNTYPAQGYYDQNQHGYEQGQYDQQGYYDQQGGPYDQQGYYDQSQGDDPNYYPQPSESSQAQPPRKRKIESVSDYYSQMLGEGHVFATDSDDSPHHETVPQEQVFYEKQYQQLQPYPPPHLVPQSPALQLLGPLADAIFALKDVFSRLSEELKSHTDLAIDLLETVQVTVHDFNLPVKSLSGSELQLSVSFCDLQELNIEFTDNYAQPLFDFSKYANSQYKVSKAIAEPAAYETALWAIRECAARAGEIPPAQEGPYANLPLTDVMNKVTEQDLQAFLRFAFANSEHFANRSLKISETFAAWVMYGAPFK